ncbi:MAG: DEAD/DEAH box helicase, partial [Patescibacteria group bacterium]
MYSSSRNNRSYGQNKPRGRFQGRGSFGGGRRQPKKLDANLFIKKATPIVAVTDEAVSSVSFTDYALVEKLQRNIVDHGYVHPTPIQEQTIQYSLEGKDVIGIANTGTGKTAAFLIPLINKVFLDRNERIFIITPTRELAMQIVDEFTLLARGMDLESALCIGGANMYRQEKRLQRNPQIVIGTPGRLKDLAHRRILNLGLFRNIVLDEVDRMVDIGFLKDIQELVALLPKKRQSLFFSATIGDKERSILREFVVDPVSISVK